VRESSSAGASPQASKASKARRGSKSRFPLLQRILAGFLLVLAAPVLALVALTVLVTDGPPVVYRSQRLGRRRRVFFMYKIRTLRRGAESVTGARLLRPTDGLTIRVGQFLRDTRLDELPQLWNVVRGEMVFVGPRPERPSVYQRQCREIRSYDRRFEVWPGLIGWSQLFTPHATDKRIRTILDNAWLEHDGLQDLRFVAFTVTAVVRKVLLRLAEKGREVVASRILRRYQPQRRLPRVQLPWAEAYSRRSHGRIGRVVDLNVRAFRIECGGRIPLEDLAAIRLRVEFDGAGGPARVRKADCRGRVMQVRRTETGNAYVIEYEPETSRSEYVIEQYFLRTSLAFPGRNGRARVRIPARALPVAPAADLRRPQSA
jgi:lipopolysaccharide/colanic/teichoic acid biosynthesis glycosyltransferase